MHSHHSSRTGEGLTPSTFSLIASNRRVSTCTTINNQKSGFGSEENSHHYELFQPSHQFYDHEIEKQFKFHRSKINYLESSLFVRVEGSSRAMIDSLHGGTEHVTLYFTNLNSKEEVHVSGFNYEEVKEGLHCIHRFYKSGNTQLYYATCGSSLMIIEAGRVVYTIDLQSSSLSESLLKSSNDLKKSSLNKLHINDVKVREGNTESNINFFYFVLGTNLGFKIIKWERIHKDCHKMVIDYGREERRVLQTSLIRELLCVVWEDGVQVYKITFSKGKIVPVSNLLVCGGRINTLFSIENTIEAEGWILVQDGSSLIPQQHDELSISKESVSRKLIVEEVEDSNIILDIKPKASSMNSSLVFPELKSTMENDHRLISHHSSVTPLVDTNWSRIVYLKIEENDVKVNTENIKLRTISPDLCYCVHDRTQNPSIHIVVANRSTPTIEYLEYNYKSHEVKNQTISLPKEQRVLGLDISHQQPSMDNILIIRSLSGEKELSSGFFFSSIGHASQHFKNIVFNKYMREIEKPPEDPNLQTPITPALSSPSDMFPTSSASIQNGTHQQQQVTLNTILRELREMKHSIDFKLDKISHDISSLDKRVHTIENRNSKHH